VLVTSLPGHKWCGLRRIVNIETMDRRAGSVAFRAVSNFHQVFLKMFGIKICRKRKIVARKRQLTPHVALQTDLGEKHAAMQQDMQQG